MRHSRHIETWAANLVRGLGCALALILMGSALAAPAGTAVHPGSELWVARYQGTPVRNIAYSVAVAPDGSAVFVTGTSDGQGTDYDFATIAYGAGTGSQIWARRYDGPSSSEDYADLSS